MKSKKFDVGFKVKAVEMLKESGRTKTSVAEDLGVSDSTLCKWVMQYDAGKFSSEQRDSKVPSTSDKEIARLTAELKRKNMELEILKKATAFFAKNQY